MEFKGTVTVLYMRLQKLKKHFSLLLIQVLHQKNYAILRGFLHSSTSFSDSIQRHSYRQCVSSNYVNIPSSIELLGVG